MSAEKKRGGIRTYFKDVYIEMKKVVWPTKKEMISYSFMVVFACAFFSLAFWAIDSVFAAGLGVLLGFSL